MAPFPFFLSTVPSGVNSSTPFSLAGKLSHGYSLPPPKMSQWLVGDTQAPTGVRGLWEDTKDAGYIFSARKGRPVSFQSLLPVLFSIASDHSHDQNYPPTIAAVVTNPGRLQPLLWLVKTSYPKKHHKSTEPESRQTAKMFLSTSLQSHSCWFSTLNNNYCSINYINYCIQC